MEAMRATYSFVRVPTSVVDALMRSRLSGSQWRVLLWVMRQTYGWHRARTPFTWYGLAKALAMDRAGAFRAGRALLQTGVLVLEGNQIGVQMDSGLWNRHLVTNSEPGQPPGTPKEGVVAGQRQALLHDNETVVSQQLNRCQETTLFRRAKDSSKEKIKKYKKIGPETGPAPHRFQNGALSERHQTRFSSDKYDGLSEN
jgi:phage replication O-like protein O